MPATSFTPLESAAGGVLIGLATTWVFILNGRIAGISGVISRSLLRVPGDTAWRVLFLLGMVAGGALGFRLLPGGEAWHPAGGLALSLAAGFLVGLGTRLGGGCTSGHGVCGLARGSRRSLAATLVFMAVAAAVVAVRRHLLEGGFRG